MKLTLMICTMPSRSTHLDRLVVALDLASKPAEQFAFGRGNILRIADAGRGVELIAYSTPAYNGSDAALTFGAKRNAILGMAAGEFVCCFDDDDEPHPRFVEAILAEIDKDPTIDCIGYKVACYGYAQTNGRFDPTIMEPADVSIRYDAWANDVGGFKYVRCPHHIVPVRREHVLAIGFREIHHGEDHEYSMRLRDSGRLKKEAYIDEFMYIYRFNAYKKPGE